MAGGDDRRGGDGLGFTTRAIHDGDVPQGIAEEPASPALRPETGAVLIETLANPTFRVSDVRGVAGVCADAGVPLVVDNTVATSFLLRPVELPEAGDLLVLHSTSKYIAG